MRLVTLIGLALSVLGAGFLLFAGWVAEEFDRFDPSVSYPGELLIAAGGVGAVAGVVAIYGLLVDARRPALVGAGVQGLVAIFVGVWAVIAERPDTELYLTTLVGVIVIDVLAIIQVRDDIDAGVECPRFGGHV